MMTSLIRILTKRIPFLTRPLQNLASQAASTVKKVALELGGNAPLILFDDADIFSCYRRSESVTPQQALALSNSALAIEAADGIAQQFASLDRETFTRRLWKTLLCREITSDELSACLDAIAQWMEIAERDGDETPEDRARARLAHTLINRNDFLSIR